MILRETTTNGGHFLPAGRGRTGGRGRQRARPQVAVRRLHGSFCQTGWYSSPAVADLDGDGQAEVIWGSYDLLGLNGADGSVRGARTNGSRGLARHRRGRPDRRRHAGDRSSGAAATSSPSTVHAGDVIVWTRNPFGAERARSAPWRSRTWRPTASSRSSWAAPAAAATKQINVYDGRTAPCAPAGPPAATGEPGYRLGHVQRERHGRRSQRRRLQGDHRPDRHPLHHRARPQRQPAPDATHLHDVQPAGPQGLEPGGRPCRPRGRPARLRQLRHRAPAELRQQRARRSPTWTATARRDRRRRRRLQLRYRRPRRRPVLPALDL